SSISIVTMGLVHILLIAIAITLITDLAPTTRAVHNAGNSGHQPPQAPHNDRSPPYKILPQHNSVWHSKLSDPLVGRLNPASSIGLMRTEDKYEKKYRSRDQDFLQQEIGKRIERLPKAEKLVEEEKKTVMVGNDSNMIESRVELIVLVRLLAKKREESSTLDRPEFLETMWDIVSFLEIMTIPSKPATGSGPGESSVEERGKYDDYFKYLERNLLFFWPKMSLALKQREHYYHDKPEVHDLETSELQERMKKLKEKLKSRVHWDGRGIIWAWENVSYLPEFLAMVKLWVNRREEMPNPTDVEEYLKDIMDFFGVLVSFLVDDRRRNVKEGIECYSAGSYPLWQILASDATIDEAAAIVASQFSTGPNDLA
ncbi:hypothetical protein H0H93_005924, partial [Arthromyces matolae]